jgi:hypothetical protein
MPRHDHAVELQKLRFDPLKLSSQRGEALTSDFWQTDIVRISNHVQQVLDAIASNGSHDAKLGKMRADGIDQRYLLLHEEVPGTVQHQDRLLVGSLGLDEPHARARDGLADRLSIARIVFLPLHIRLHIGRRHEANCVT